MVQSATFQAKDGAPAMMMLMMSEAEWQAGGEEAFEKMLKSTK